MKVYESTVNNVISEHNDNIVFIGFRGSYALFGDTVTHNDIDLLVVLKEHSGKTVMENDIQLISSDNFVKSLKNARLESIEAISSIVYINKNYIEDVENYKELFRTDEVADMFEAEIYMIMKNQIKQVNKFKNKFGKYYARLWLHYHFLKDSSLSIRFYREKDYNRELLEEYWIVKNTTTYEKHDRELLKQMIDYRNNNEKTRDHYLLLKNRASNRLRNIVY